MNRREILAREVAEKLRLEALVKPGIRKIFARLVDDFRISVGRTGSVPDISRYRTSFEALLEDHYRRVQKSFSGAILLHNKVDTLIELRGNKAAQKDEDESDMDELIAAIFLLWREQHAPEQADIITRTTARDMEEAMSQARQALLEQGKPIDKRSLATTAAVILKRITRGRVDLIALTETQAAAETTKAIEAGAVVGVMIPGIPVPPSVAPAIPRVVQPTTEPWQAPRAPDKPVPGSLTQKKSWYDLRDKKVRATHLEAGRRYQASPIPINEAFIVGGSRMMFPGDRSLGAAIKELANCRCSAIYTIGVAA